LDLSELKKRMVNLQSLEYRRSKAQITPEMLARYNEALSVCQQAGVTRIFEVLDKHFLRGFLTGPPTYILSSDPPEIREEIANWLHMKSHVLIAAFILKYQVPAVYLFEGQEIVDPEFPDRTYLWLNASIYSP
jgi:hypothetical protein